jgi:hypothetical protein
MKACIMKIVSLIRQFHTIERSHDYLSLICILIVFVSLIIGIQIPV